ncbi:MAG: hypothetical protein IIT36_00190 [Aeriscardovia sp.]|nr:hypothetical protein [Aeriscardovia sp.]
MSAQKKGRPKRRPPSGQSHSFGARFLGIVARVSVGTWLAIAVVAMVLSLGASLLLHVKMDQDSFTMASLQTTIGVLTQDVQDEQIALNKEEYSLPQKAEQMGMVLATNSITINLAKPLGTPINPGYTNVLLPNLT